jgi:hypothetical protein
VSVVRSRPWAPHCFNAQVLRVEPPLISATGTRKKSLLRSTVAAVTKLGHKFTEIKMSLRRAAVACIVCGAALLGFPGVPAHSETLNNCKEPKSGTKEIPIFSPPLSNVVIGVGRLQFYSAPSFRCRMNGVFVVPRDELIAYGETNDGWSSVMYVNPRTGNNVSGWVRSERLKQTGTVGPKQ